MESELDERLTTLWRDHSRQVFAFATRHVGPQEAEEVTAETFVIAWRRLEVVPSQALPWLLVTARNVMRTQRRSVRRRHAAQRELQSAVEVDATVDSAESTAVEKLEVARALWQLSAKEREALFLVAWDGLSLTDGARVAKCSLSAFTMRVSRARARLRAAVPSMDTSQGPRRMAVESLELGERHG